MPEISTTTTTSRTTWGSTATAAGLSAVSSLAVNGLIAWVARDASDRTDTFEPLATASWALPTIAGAVVGAVGWRLIVAHHRQAGRLLRWLVPTVLALSLIPDVLLLTNDSEPGATAGRVGALMLMHLAIGLVSVPLYRKFMPPRT